MQLPRSRGTIQRLSLALWTLTLALAAFLTWNLLSSLSCRESDRTRIAEFYEQASEDLVRFRSGLNRVRLTRPGGNLHQSHMSVASMQLRPQRPELPSESSPETTSSETGGEEDAPEEGGPLAEDWEYAGGLFIANDPSRSRVWLRRKEDPRSLRSRYSRTRTRRSSRVVRRARSRRTARSRARPKDLVSFYAAADEFKDEELELDFLIRSVNWEEIVYSPAEDPEEKYVLERAGDSPYSFWEEKRLEPFAEEDGEDGENEEPGDEEEKKKHFRVREPDYVNRVEKDYQRLLRGVDPPPDDP